MRINKKYKITVTLIIFLSLADSSFPSDYFKKTQQPNVILITIDALRPDHLGCYGYRRDTSPNIDKLAKEGILFTQAISQSTFTISSLVSLYTSLYPIEHSLNSWLQTFPHSIKTCPEILKQRSYYTGFMTANNGLRLLASRFDTFEISSNAKAITQNAIGWIKKNKNKKLFLWLHYIETHVPYRPPEPYNKKYLYDNLYNQNNTIPISTNTEGIMQYGGFGCIPFILAENGIREVDYYIAQYDGAISFIDEQIGVLLKAIQDLKLDKKTLIVLTSDHGEYMGEHDFYFFHHFIPYDCLIKVPLILKYNTILPKHKIVDQRVALIDIVPTIFGLLGIDAKMKASGMDLVPMILKDKHYPSRTIFSEVFLVGDNSKPRFTSVREGDWKLIYDSLLEKYELYNLKNDPSELINLAEIEKIKCGSLKQRLNEHAKCYAAIQVPIAIQSLDEETKRQLRSLGYIQ
jgi:arylsulfatase A-like enzyme